MMMYQNNRISVAMAVYNGDKYLREQLDSIYTQSLVPDEIIVVDDDSQDDSVKILEEYHQRYGLKYYVNNCNLGINKNFEKAISLCSGDYIALSDQDDVWLPHKIETSLNHLKEMENNQPSLVSSASTVVNEHLQFKWHHIRSKDTDLYIDTFLNHLSQGCTMMMNRSLIPYILPLPPFEEIAFDNYIGLTAALVGNKLYISNPLLYYRSHATNVSDLKERKYSIFQRFKIKYGNRYPGLIQDKRFNALKVVKKYHFDEFKEDRKRFCNKILSLDCKGRFWFKLRVLWSLNEFSIGKRIFLIVNFVISYSINFFFRDENCTTGNVS